MGLLKSNEVQMFAIVVRQIWLRRNAIVHGEALFTPSMVLRIAREQIEGYETTMAPLSKELEPEHSIPQNTMLLWKAPPMGYIKLNWDASIDVGSQRMGLGVVAHIHMGEVLAMYCDSKPFVQDPSIIEALTVRQAVLMSAKYCIFEPLNLYLLSS
jgi:hypothetical protein